MIDIDTLEAVAPYVEHNSSNYLLAVPGSTLANLTQALIEKSKFIVSARDANSDDFNVSDIINVVSKASQGDTDYIATHQDMVNEATKHITRIMRNNIYLTRTVVLPIIERYTTQLTEVVSSKCNRSVLALNIIEDKKRTILSSPQLKSVVQDQSSRVRYDDIALPRFHSQELTVPELLNLLKTGSKGFDETIEQWINANQLEDKVKQTYHDIFYRSSSRYTDFLKYVNVGDYDGAIIALLMCWGLVKNVQDDINVGFDSYKKDMEVFSAACSGIINQAVEKFERSVRYKNLVLQYPAVGRQFTYNAMDKNNIIVDAGTYGKFLEMGGSPEIIFGAYLSDRAVDLDGIIAGTEKYLKEYQRQVSRGKLTAINNTLTVVKEELDKIAFQIVKDVTDGSVTDGDEQHFENITVGFTGTKHVEDARAFIGSIGSRDIENYYLLMLNFVCDCFFKGTNVGALIRKIDALDPEGEKDINELAIIATTDLIVDWFISQIETDTKSVSLEGYYTN